MDATSVDCIKLIMSYAIAGKKTFARVLQVCKNFYALRFDFAKSVTFKLTLSWIDKLQGYNPQRIVINETRFADYNDEVIEHINATKVKDISLHLGYKLNNELETRRKRIYQFIKTEDIFDFSKLRFVETLEVRSRVFLEKLTFPPNIKHLTMINLETWTLEDIAPNIESIKAQTMELLENAHFPNLRRLVVEKKWTGFTWMLTDFTNLRELRFNGSFAPFHHFMFEHLPNLEVLGVEYLSEEGFENIKHLQHLKQLECRYCKNENLEALRDLHCLEYLTLSNQKVFNDISALKDLPNLVYLDMMGCLISADVSFLFTLQNLKIIKIKNKTNQLKFNKIQKKIFQRKNSTCRKPKSLFDQPEEN